MAGKKALTPDQVKIAENIKSVREHADKKQREVAGVLGYTTQHYSAIENATRAATSEFIICFANHFNIHVEKLYRGTSYEFQLDLERKIACYLMQEMSKESQHQMLSNIKHTWSLEHDNRSADDRIEEILEEASRIN